MLQKIRPTIFLVFVAFLLVACFEFDSTIHLNPDGSGRAEFAYRFPPGLLDSTDIAGKIPLTQKDVDARYRMRAGVTQYRAEFRDLPQFKEVRLFLDFDNIASLSERGSTYSYTVEGPYKVLRIKIDKTTSGAPNAKQKNQFQQVMLQKALDRYSITFKVYLPEKIDTSNAQKVEWNAATWDIPLSAFMADEKQVIILEAKSKIGLWERLKWKISHGFNG
jgi:hypothetical protein